MPTSRLTGLAVAALVFVLDQISKWLVVDVLHLPARGQIELLPIFRLLWVNNAGVSLGLLTATTAVQGWGLTALTGAIAAAVCMWLWRESNRQEAFALGLVFGGALGNILDRVRTGITSAPFDEPGHVIDFANLHFGAFSPFLVFNLADAAITIGVLILVFRAFLARDKSKVSVDA